MQSIGLVVLLISMTIGLSLADEGPEPEQCPAFPTSSYDLDTVTLFLGHFDQDSYPPELTYATSTEIYRNGSALWWSAVYAPDQYADNISSWHDVGGDFFDQVVAAMESEGYFSMQEHYCDARSGHINPPIHTLTVSGPGFNRTVTFEDNTMFGLMPETYCLMDGPLMENVSIGFEMVEISSLVFELSCVVINEGASEVWLSSVSYGTWGFDVVRENGCTFIPWTHIFPLTWTTVDPYSEKPFGNQTINCSSLPDGNYSVVVHMGSSLEGYTLLTVEGNDGYVNTPPLDHGVILSQEDASSNEWTIEILKCCDQEDRVEDILIRWDWDSDGSWDTDWRSEKTCTQEFEDPDHLNITYELMDTDGGTSTGWISSSYESGTTIGYIGGPVVIGLVVACAVITAVLVFLALRKRGEKDIRP